MKLILSLLLIVSALVDGRAQECLGTPFKAGMGYEMITYNAKDKPVGKVNYLVKNVRREGGSTLIDISIQTADERGKTQPPYTVQYVCTGNELVADLSGLTRSIQGPTAADLEMKLNVNRLTYPSKLSIGQKLPNGVLEAELFSNGNRTMEINMTVNNRQVEGSETLTTPAGTFNTYKLTSDVAIDNRAMGMPIRLSVRTVSYRTNDLIFDVKTENFNKNGKLMSYSLLSKLY